MVSDAVNTGTWASWIDINDCSSRSTNLNTLSTFTGTEARTDNSEISCLTSSAQQILRQSKRSERVDFSPALFVRQGNQGKCIFGGAKH